MAEPNSPLEMDAVFYAMERSDCRSFVSRLRATYTYLQAKVRDLEAALDEAQLRSIEARNPGIDMDEVRRRRAPHTDSEVSA